MVSIEEVSCGECGISAGGVFGASAPYGFQFNTTKTFKSWQVSFHISFSKFAKANLLTTDIQKIMYFVFGILTIAWEYRYFLAHARPSYEFTLNARTMRRPSRSKD